MVVQALMCCVALVVSASTPVDEATNSLGANAPVSIGEPGVTPQSTPSVSTAESTPSPIVIPSEVPVPVKAIAQQERLPLGQAAKKATAAGADTSEQGWRTLDPRTNDIVRTTGALALVVGLIFVIQRFVRKRGGDWLGRAGRPSGVLEILARYPIGRQQTLVLLKIGRRLLLLHQTASSMTTLSEMTDTNEVANLIARVEAGSRPADRERFGELLNQWAAEHDVTTPRGRISGETVDLTRRSTRRLIAATKVAS